MAYRSSPLQSPMEITNDNTETLDGMSYTRTATSFIKSGFGDTRKRPWYPERLRNEAAALELIASRTTIPVPKLINFGTTQDGVPYLEMEQVHGIPCYRVGDKCRMPHLHRSGAGDSSNNDDEDPCSACQTIATANAERFIEDIVLPQLRQLKSKTTGLNGFVIPSVWILNHDKRDKWEVKESETEDFVFCHGDLTTHNMMCDEKTLEITHLYDWEHAGYFPVECQHWSLNFPEYYILFENTTMLDRDILLIKP